MGIEPASGTPPDLFRAGFFFVTFAVYPFVRNSQDRLLGYFGRTAGTLGR
jgi:hypothetical protein